MKSVQQIKQSLTDALENCGVFDSVLTPTDDRLENTVMREPSCAVVFKGCTLADENGVQLTEVRFQVLMKFLKIGVNDTAEDIETAVNAVSTLEPVSLTQQKTSESNSRSALYLIDVSFRGCRG